MQVAGRDRIKSLLPLESTGDLYWSDWVPQVAVLDHPAVKGFISHGGSTSVQEALWFGKPILCVPVLWDQFYSSWIAEQLGFGVWADGIGSPRRSVHWKVDKLINDSTIRTRAVALSLEIRRHPGDLEVVEELACVARASKKNGINLAQVDWGWCKGSRIRATMHKPVDDVSWWLILSF